jgi:hypothetical protein
MVWSNFTKENLKKFTKFKYSLDNDNILLGYIKNERNNIINFISKSKLILPSITKLDSYDDIYKYVKGRFVDTENLLKDMKTLNYIYKIKWGDNIIIINSEDEIKLSKKIKIIIYMIEYLKEKTQNNKNVNIYLVLSRLEKKFPKNSKVMGVQNANSGYNDSSNDSIVIWRKEEFEKVLFHELIHNFDLDKRDEHVHDIINTTGPHLYFEALTDFQGIIYHLIYLSLMTQRKIINLLEYELGFIRNQAMNLNDIWELGNWYKFPKIMIEQKTAAFSYYILKYLMFEYFLNNEFNTLDNYKTILNNVLQNKFSIVEFIKIDSSRMTLLQLG